MIGGSNSSTVERGKSFTEPFLMVFDYCAPGRDSVSLGDARTTGPMEIHSGLAGLPGGIADRGGVSDVRDLAVPGAGRAPAGRGAGGDALRPAVTVICAVAAFAVLIFYWRRSREGGSAILAAPGAVLVCLLAGLSRVNIYELMFHPDDRPAFRRPPR